MNPQFPLNDMKEAPVRYRDNEFQYRCPTCKRWLPLTLDFWRPGNGMRLCRACLSDYQSMKTREYTAADPGIVDVRRMKARIAYQLNREKKLNAGRQWRAANRERIREYNRLYRERMRQERAA